MFNTATELFLNAYFMFEAVVGKVIGDSRYLFDVLYDAYLLPSGGKAELIELTQNDELREIETYADYAQTCRIQKYSELAGIRALSEEIADIVAVKGDALRRTRQCGFGKCGDMTESAVCKLVSDYADMGLVVPLCILAFLRFEGIFFDKNVKKAKSDLEKAALWNSVDGLLLALYFDRSNRQSYLDRLFTATQGSIYDGLSERATKLYGERAPRALADARLLDKAFSAGFLKPELYVPQYARFIFSDVLSYRDKERALFSGHKDLMTETADLPLKLSYGEIPFDAQAALIPPTRIAEWERICMSARNADLRRSDSFRPTCVCTDSDYMLKVYRDALQKAFCGANIERIDVSGLNDYDLGPTKSNVFVNGCDEDKHNVFLLCYKGEIKESVMIATRSFLQSDRRGKFRLQQPPAVIDLRSALPVCLCDRRNVAALKPYCDVIEISPVRAEEKRAIIEYILSEKAREYNMNGVSADADAVEMLSAYSIDKAESLIDKAVRFNRNAAVFTVTAAALKAFSTGAPDGNNKYGFGGADNENK